jgi:hypothetical protein
MTNPQNDFALSHLVADYLRVGNDLITATTQLGMYLSAMEAGLGEKKFAEWVSGVLPESNAKYFIELYATLMSKKNWSVSWRLTDDSGKEITLPK